MKRNNIWQLHELCEWDLGHSESRSGNNYTHSKLNMPFTVEIFPQIIGTKHMEMFVIDLTAL